MNKRETPRSQFLNALIFASPVLVIALMTAMISEAPGFYQQYVQDRNNGEFKFIELATVALSLAAGLMLCYCAVVFGSDKGLSWGVTMIGIMGLGCLFMAGEEISWGQVWMNWGSTPLEVGPAMNLHNNDIFNATENAGVFSLSIVFFWLPLLWRTRLRKYLPASLERAIPGIPVCFAMVFALLFEGDFLRIPPVGDALMPIVSRFPDQWNLEEARFHINETKEFLVALALLMYSCSCLSLIRKRQQVLPLDASSHSL